jgi:hypothetical protein
MLLEKEFDHYIKHQEELVKKYNGKILVIKGEEIIGVFNNEIDAIEETSKTHELGTFLVHKCEPGEQGYTAMYHSRACFA